MSEKRWKAFERRVAAILGGRRVPVTGRSRGDAPDIAHPLYAVEVKHWTRQPETVLAAMRQAKASVRDSRIPVVVIGSPGVDVRRSLVILELGDFADHFGGPSL